MYVVVTGPPASGKSTLTRVLAAELGWPLLAKDTIKAGLVESLGAEGPDGSRRLGAAAVRALLALARDNPGGAVLDSVWVDRERAVAELAALPGQVVEVFCRADRGCSRSGTPRAVVGGSVPPKSSGTRARCARSPARGR